MKRKALPSSVEIWFDPTPDGLVFNHVILHCANLEAENDLRKFLARFKDPEIDLTARATWIPDEATER